MSRRWLYLCFAFLVAAFCVSVAHASSDRVSFLHDINISADEEVGDAVCFLCSIHADGKINGDAVAFLGSIRLNNEISGDTVSFLGGVNLTDEARIGGSCVVFGGPLRRGGGSIGGDTVQFPFILLMMPFILFGLLIYGIVALVNRRRYAAYPVQPPQWR